MESLRRAAGILSSGYLETKKIENYIKYRFSVLKSLERGVDFLSQDLLLNRVIHIPREQLTHYLTVSSQSGEPLGGTSLFSNRFVRRGDWDKNTKPLIPDYCNQDHKRAVSFRSTFQVFKEGVPFRECDEYKMKLTGKSRYVRASEAELEEKFRKLAMLFDSIKNNGYKSQRELGKSRLKWANEIKIVIDRDGCLIKIAEGGNHRLAIAHILQVEHLPVYILGVHFEWVMKCCRKYGFHPLCSIKKELDLLNYKLT